MGWDRGDAEEPEERENPEKVIFTDEIYTLQKNPVYIATKALFLSLRRSWELTASEPGKIPQPLSIGFLSSLHRCEEQASWRSMRWTSATTRWRSASSSGRSPR
jgi:hypothetical protein